MADEMDEEFEGMTELQILRALFKGQQKLATNQEALTSEFREANGRCRKHEVVIHGDEEHQIVGIKPMVLEHDEYILRQRTMWKVIYSIVGAIGVSNLGIGVVVVVRWVIGS